MGYALGIDLGTTYTAAAIHRDGRVETVSLGSHANTIPTVAYARESGEILVGEAALARGLNDPGRFGKEFKRRLGSDTPVILGGAAFDAEDLLGRVLASVVETVSAYCGEPPTHLVVTHPASWADHRLERLRNAVAATGIDDASFAAEPEAAAVFYSAQERVSDGSVIAVYDLGGGTFDASVLRKSADGFELVARPEGDDTIGGIDFDRAVLEHVAASLGDAWTGLDLTDGAVASGMEQLRRSATSAKELLSDDLEVTIPVSLPGIGRDVRLTRGEFEDRIRPDVESTLATMQRALDNAALPPEDIDTVLLVGGSSRVPLVGEIVGNGLGLPLAVDAHPKLAICQGAAIIAAERGGLLEPQPEPQPEPGPEPVVVPATTPPQVAEPAPTWRDHLTARNIGIGAAVFLAAIIAYVTLGGDDSGGGTDRETGPATPVTTATADPPTTEGPPVDDATGLADEGFAIASPAATFLDAEAETLTEVDGALEQLASFAGFTTISECTADTFDAGAMDAAENGIERLAASSPDAELVRRLQLAYSVYEDLRRRCTDRVEITNTTPADRIANTEGFVDDWIASIRSCATTGTESASCAPIAEVTALEVDDLSPAVDFGPAAFTPLGLDGEVWQPMQRRRVDGQLQAQLARLDAESGETIGLTELPGGAETPLLVDGLLWVPATSEPFVHLVDPADGRLVETLDVGANPFVLRLGDRFVFVPNRDDGTVSAIDRSTLEVTTVRIGEGSTRLGGAGAEVWAGTDNEARVVRLDPETAEIDVVIELDGAPSGMVSALGSLWVTARPGTSGTSSVVRIPFDDLEAEPTTIALASSPRDVIEASGAIWVPTADGRVSRINPDTNLIDAVVTVGGDPRQGAVGAGYVWFSSLGTGTLARIDPTDPTAPPLIIPISFANRPDNPVDIDDEIWVAFIDQSTVVRIRPG